MSADLPRQLQRLSLLLTLPNAIDSSRLHRQTVNYARSKPDMMKYAMEGFLAVSAGYRLHL